MSEAPDLLGYVKRHVIRELRDAGYGPEAYPDDEWLRKQIRAAPNQDWSDSEVRDGNTSDIGRRAITRAKRKRISPAPTKPAKIPMPTGVGKGIILAYRHREEIRAVRRWLFGQEDPLFPNTAQGHDEAVAWLNQEAEKARAAMSGKRPGRMRFTVTVEVEDLPAFSQDVDKELLPKLMSGRVLSSAEADLPPDELISSFLGSVDISLQPDEGRGEMQEA